MVHFFVSLLLALNTSSAFAEDMVCQTKVNSVPASQRTISVPDHASVPYGEVEGFRFKVNSFGDSKFEIEVFSGNDLFRSYADGTLRSMKDELKWSYWSRDELVEAYCKLNTVRLGQ